jgi:hypothetical protein
MTKPNGRRNVALKLDEHVHAQLTVLAGMEAKLVPDVIREAVTEHLARKRVELADRAADVLAAIDREAEARRATIQTLFGTTESQSEPEPAKARSRRGSEAMAS